MTKIWDQDRVEQYISQGIEESLNLDYKAADALEKNEKKKNEIRKDVSAMANSDGGIIIYGLTEDTSNRHLPGSLDPIDRNTISKEWLEQVISNIRPKIEGVIIHPVTINDSKTDVVYVVEIPRSHTAHQASDKRYYKRFNFQSVPMEDYEIRDVMGRLQHARIELEFAILTRIIFTGRTIPDRSLPLGKGEPETETIYELIVTMVNTGKVYAQYIEARIEMPCDLVFDFDVANGFKPSRRFDIDQYCIYDCDNTKRDITGHSGTMPIGLSGTMSMIPKYGPARYVPLLPKRKIQAEEFRLCKNFKSIDWKGNKIKWTTYADNAPPYSGEIAISEIEIVDEEDENN